LPLTFRQDKSERVDGPKMTGLREEMEQMDDGMMKFMVRVLLN